LVAAFEVDETGPVGLCEGPEGGVGAVARGLRSPVRLGEERG
jgi:hypothetical protein